MTALDRYLRLEATGFWREGFEAPPREVIVAFGRATLILRDLDESPIGHWALAGMRIIDRSGGAAIYATTEDGAETLTIPDDEMNAAIAAVSREMPPAGPGRAVAGARHAASWAWAFGLVAALAAAAVFGPDLVRAQATRMLPPEQAAEFGDRMLLDLMEGRGGLCDETAGKVALDRIGAALAGSAAPRIRVLPLGASPVAALPGHTVLLNRTTLLDAVAPAEVAGWVALGLGRAPARALMQDAGLPAAAGYVFTGDLAPGALSRAAGAALTRQPTFDEARAALGRLGAAGIDAAPFAAALQRAGLTGLKPPSAPAAGSGAPLLSDQEWVALRSICG